MIDLFLFIYFISSFVLLFFITIHVCRRLTLARAIETGCFLLLLLFACTYSMHDFCFCCHLIVAGLLNTHDLVGVSFFALFVSTYFVSLVSSKYMTHFTRCGQWNVFVSVLSCHYSNSLF